MRELTVPLFYFCQERVWYQVKIVFQPKTQLESKGLNLDIQQTVLSDCGHEALAPKISRDKIISYKRREQPQTRLKLNKTAFVIPFFLFHNSGSQGLFYKTGVDNI